MKMVEKKSGTRSVKKYVIIGAIGAGVLVAILYALAVTRPPGSTIVQSNGNEEAPLPGNSNSTLPGTDNTPYITIFPNPYTLGEPATITGHAFTPNAEIILTLNGQVLQTTSATIVADSAGIFEVETVISETEGEGEQILTATDTSGVAASTTLPIGQEATAPASTA
jgi:hypothetical protein